MINKIEIKLMNYIVFIKNDICIINNKTINLKKEDIDNMIRMIRNWKELYTNHQIIGENHDYINIYENNNKYEYIFHNSYPKDIECLVNYLGEMYER